ncbi:hypothetical protein KC359_g8921 [Hortaea werneckii]|nr:hypothetical protein KC359_g8921 [Hortaea werneckii]
MCWNENTTCVLCGTDYETKHECPDTSMILTRKATETVCTNLTEIVYSFTFHHSCLYDSGLQNMNLDEINSLLTDDARILMIKKADIEIPVSYRRLFTSPDRSGFEVLIPSVDRVRRPLIIARKDKNGYIITAPTEIDDLAKMWQPTAQEDETASMEM